MCGVGAEQHDLRIGFDANTVPCGPVEAVASLAAVFRTRPVKVRHDDGAFDDVPPVRGLTSVAFEPVEQRGDVGARRQTEVLSGEITAGLQPDGQLPPAQP